LVIPNEEKVRELDEALIDFETLKIELTCDWEEIKKRTVDRGDRTLSEAKRSFSVESSAFEADVSIDTTQTSSTEIAKRIIPLLKNKMGEIG
jgi:chloramphenicol 3-O-phosphotransferase